VEPIEEFRYLVLAVQREGNRLFAAALKPAGVTPSQAEVLRVLEAREPLTLSALGELLVCETGSSPSRLVDRLVALGLVDRQVHRGDRRYVTLVLTRQGHETAQAVAQAERHLYHLLRLHIGDRPLEPALELLRLVAGGSPAGEALARRAESA